MLAQTIPGRLPTSADEVQTMIAEMAAAGRRIEVIGGGTKRSIGHVETDLTLSLAGMSQVIDYAPDELVLTAQAGVKLSELEKLTAEQGQMLAFEPPRWTKLLGSAGEPTLGGALAGNLSGPRRVRAGAARDHFLGFEAISGRGERFKAGGKVVKNVTGYDLMKLMAGSWGTLAVLTEVTIKVMPAPRAETTLLLFGLSDERAAEAMTIAMNSPFEVSGAAHLPAFAAASKPLKATMPVTALRLEGFETSVAARTGGLAGALKGFGKPDKLTDRHSRDLWVQVREAQAFAGERALWRLSVPPASGWRAAQAAGGEALYDWAGGLVWLLSDADPAKVRQAARDHGGHALRVRGGGLAFDAPEGALGALNARVKAAFDPLGVLNPGRLGGPR